MRLQQLPAAVAWGTLGLLVLLAGCVPPPKGGSGIPRKDLDVKTSNNLTQIGLAYQTAAITGPVKGPGELKQSLEGHGEILISPRDKEPYEIVWRVDPSRIPEGSSNALLAWEKTADPDGKRWVLYADGHVQKLDEQAFEKAPRARPNS